MKTKHITVLCEDEAEQERIERVWREYPELRQPDSRGFKVEMTTRLKTAENSSDGSKA